MKKSANNKGRAKGPSQRQLRVGEEIRHILAWTIERGELHDPVLAETPVTLTEVSVSPDLRNALVMVVPLGGGDPTEVLAALRRAAPALRHVLAEKMTMKYIPQLRFQADTRFDRAQYIESLMQRPEVLRDTHPERLRDEGEDEDGDEDGDREEGPDPHGA